MKFVMIKEYDYNVSKDKVIIGEIKENDIGYYENGESYESTLNDKVSIAYLLNIGDFDLNNEFNIILNIYIVYK